MSENNIYIVYLDDVPQFYTKTQEQARLEAKNLADELVKEEFIVPSFVEKKSEDEYVHYLQNRFFFVKYDTLEHIVRVGKLSERK